MSTWRTLLTPHVSKYIDSQNRENSLSNLVETPMNINTNSQHIAEINSSKRVETSEFGDTKKLKYQQKLDKIQKEILELKRQNISTIEKDFFSSNKNEISNTENFFCYKKTQEKMDLNEKPFLKKPNEQINYIITNYVKENKRSTNKKSKKNSFHDKKKFTNRKRNPSYLSLKDFNISTDEIKNSKNLNLEFKQAGDENDLSNNSIGTQSMDHLDYGINLTNLVKSLQHKLKKEIHLRLETNKKLRQSTKEIINLKSYINKLENELDQMKNIIKIPNILSPNNDDKMKIYDLLSDNKQHFTNAADYKSNKINDDESRTKRESENTIKDLMSTKSELLDALERILQMHTSNKDKEPSLFTSQNEIENALQKFKLSKKKFNKKKMFITKSTHNYDLPLQSNSNSNNSSIKEEQEKNKKNDITLKLEGKENINTNIKMETSNNLVYTPSNFESLSFLENLKESKNSKIL